MSKRLEQITVLPNATIREAMIAIDIGGYEICLVVDNDGHLIGTLTDGDIRRALLGGAILTGNIANYVNRKFISVGREKKRVEVLDLMKAHIIGQIPIVDENGYLCGLHVLREIIGGVRQPNWAVVMAGGRGERLRPLTDTIPKPMIKVAGRPILERTILHLIGAGIKTIFLAVNYKSEIIEDYFKDGSEFGCKILYLKEEKPLGTGGALSLLPELPKKPILVLNGDLLTQFDIGEFLSFHNKNNNYITVGAKFYSHTIPFGVLQVEENNVVKVREKPSQRWLINSGIYVIEPKILQRIPYNEIFYLPSLIEMSIEKGEKVGAHFVDSDWIDIGRTDELKRARGEFQET